MSRIVVLCCVVCVFALALLPVASAAQEAVDDVAVEQELLHALFDLDERLELGTFPDGTGPWFGRLAASLERRADRDATTGVLAERLRRFDRSDLDLLGPAIGPEDEIVWKRNEALRVLEAADQLVLHLSDPMPSGGASVTVEEGIDQLAQVSAGSLSGRVTDEATGAGIEAFVRLLPESDDPALTVMTDPDGTYVVEGVAPGSYRVHAFAEGYGSEVFDQVPCGFVCLTDAGSPVAVGDGVETSGIDFSLGKAGSITGRVTDSVTGDPIGGFYLRVIAEAGGGKLTRVSNGVYRLDEVYPGRYFVYSRTGFNYTNEVYDDVPCTPVCDWSSGTPVTVGLEETVSGIDLALDPHGSIAGRLVDEKTGEGISYEGSVGAYDEEGELVEAGSVGWDGYFLLRELPAGDYTIKATVVDYRSEMWDDIVCDGTCDVTTGTVVSVSSGDDTSGVDFALERRGEIAGTVLDQDTREPLQYVEIQVYDGETQVGKVYTAADGSYLVSDLDAGALHVVAIAREHQDELWNDLPCEGGCDRMAGESVAVSFGAVTSGIDFQLVPYGAIAGTVTLERPSPWLTLGVDIKIHEVSGWNGDTVRVQPDGTYRSKPLPPGSYRVSTDSYSHRNEVYPGLPCVGRSCDLSAGADVVVDLRSTTPSIDFHLDRLGAIDVAAVGSDTGEFRSGRVRVYEATGAFRTSAQVSSPSQQIWGLEPGGYFLRYEDAEVRYGEGYQDELYPDVPCESDCDFGEGQLVQVGLNQDPAVVTFALEPCPWATVNDFRDRGFVTRDGATLAGCDQILSNTRWILSGADVTFLTGRSVVLEDGFVVESGASFRVEIVPEWSQSPP